MYNLQPGTIHTCSAHFYDMGGINGNIDNFNNSETFCSENSERINFYFNSFNINNSNLYIYDGPNITSPLIGNYTPVDTLTGINITSTGSCLTFKFICNLFGWPPLQGWASTITCIPIPMAFSSATVTQDIVLPVSTASTNNQVIGIQVSTIGTLSPISASSFSFNTTGSTNVSDITNAKLWYTGTVNSFATNTQFGNTVSAPSGIFNITGTDRKSVV